MGQIVRFLLQAPNFAQSYLFMPWKDIEWEPFTKIDLSGIFGIFPKWLPADWLIRDMPSAIAVAIGLMRNS